MYAARITATTNSHGALTEILLLRNFVSPTIHTTSQIKSEIPIIKLTIPLVREAAFWSHLQRLQRGKNYFGSKGLP